MTKHLRLLSLLTLLATALPGLATNYYVTQSGAGNKDGSSAANAWALSDFNGSSKPTGGDTVIFSGSFSATIGGGSNGSTSSPLTFDLKQATFTSGFSLSNRSNLAVLGGTTSPSYSGDIVSLNGCTNVNMDGWTYLGSNINGSPSFIVINRSTNITIANARCVNCGYGFVGDINRTVTLTGCDVLTSQNATNQVDIIHFGSATDVIIEKCKFVLRAPGNASIRHNDVIQTYRSGASGGFDSSNWIIRYNWIQCDNVQPASDGNSSWTMMEALVGKPAIKVYSNVFTCPSLSGGGGANNGIRDNKNPNAGDTHYLYNNTIIKRANPGNVIYYLAPGTAIWKNNILWSPSGQSSGNPNSTMSTTADYNFFYRNGTNFVGSHGSSSLDPQLKDPTNNDYSLAAGSPCIGKADNSIGAEYNTGIAPGATWPNPALATRTGAWDVGAFVYAGGPGPSPSPSPSPTPGPSPTPTPADKFSTGDYVTPSATVNVRDNPAGTVLGTHIPGEIGQVRGGPVIANLNGAPVNWYEIGWTDDPADGWVGDDNLDATAKPNPTPTPTPTPPPNPTPTPAPTATPAPSPGSPTYEKWIENQNNWIRANPPKPD